MYRRRKNQKRKRRVVYRKQKWRTGGFLNRCDSAYAARDTVNQAAKVAPGVIKNVSNKINNI